MEFETAPITLSDLRSPEDFLLLPKLKRKYVQYLWMVGTFRAIRWIVEYEGHKCCLYPMPDDALLAESSDTAERSLIVKLTDGQWDQEREWNEWEAEVGRLEDWNDEAAIKAAYHKRRNVYDANAKRKRDFSNNEVLGWV